MAPNKAEPLSNYGTKPTQISKSDVPRLNEDALNKLADEIHLNGDPAVGKDFDFPCNDDSRGVEDFQDWVYFKRPHFHEPPVNMKSSFLWCPELLEKIRDQRNYRQFVPEQTLTGYKETRTNLDRKKRAKRMLAIWKKGPNTVAKLDGSKAAATAKNTGGKPFQSQRQRGVSPPKARKGAK